MPAAKQDLYIEQGATFRRSLIWSATTEDGVSGPIDLTGYKARMQVRRTQGGPVVIALNSLPNGGLTLGTTNGRIDILITDEQTDLLTPKTALYDLEVENPDGDVTRLMQGKVTVDPNITQEADDPQLEV